jgi:hypothetical protein
MVCVSPDAVGSSSLVPFQFPGRHEDDRGAEDIIWTVRTNTRRFPPGQSGFELRTSIRGVEYWGYDVDGLGTDDAEAAALVGLPVDLDEKDAPRRVLSGELPCTLEHNGRRSSATISFALSMAGSTRTAEPNPKGPRLRTALGDRTFEVAGEVFEDAISDLEAVLPEGVSLVCCSTCLFSDYSPLGHGCLGMACHRGAKAQYLAVKSKSDYWGVPRTEEVMETHLCPEYERRVPGTGYRS